jgi:hypothetical protein
MKARNVLYSAWAEEPETCQAGPLIAAAGHTEHQAAWCDDGGLAGVSGGRRSRSM